MMPGALKEGTEFAGGEYRILRKLDAGGMGDVYVAMQRGVECERALKLMHAQLVEDPTLRKLFAQEARVGARIRSDHVVQVVGAGVDDATGLPWLAMELLAGRSLAQRLRAEGPLSLPEFQVLMNQLCHALTAAHAEGIVHRDLKPENIFLAEPRQSGVPFFVKVLDFGIAKMVASTSTMESRSLGTPLWMAPEQMDSGQEIGPPTDVWPLGLIAFKVLTGHHYLRAADVQPVALMSILRELTIDPLVPASQRAAEFGGAALLPPGFDGWFGRCVAREISHRFRDAGEAHEALQQVLGQPPRPASAQPQGTPPRALTPQRGLAPQPDSYTPPAAPKAPARLLPLLAAGGAMALLIGAGAWAAHLYAGWRKPQPQPVVAQQKTPPPSQPAVAQQKAQPQQQPAVAQQEAQPQPVVAPAAEEKPAKGARRKKDRDKGKAQAKAKGKDKVAKVPVGVSTQVEQNVPPKQPIPEKQGPCGKDPGPVELMGCCDKGNPEGCHILGRYYQSKGKTSLAKIQLDRACRMGDGDACADARKLSN